MASTVASAVASTVTSAVTTTAAPLGPSVGQDPLFHWADYLVLALTLGVSLLIGLYYGCFGTKQKTDLEYLLANRQMKTIPVAISLIAGFISGITLLGTPADIYSYGTQYFAIVIGIFFMAFAISYLYIPVFVNLGVRSSFEYLNVRFGENYVRTLSAAIFLIDAIITIPLYVYVPCLALETVTGYPRNYIALIVMVVTVTYTTLGGLKAVIWTDAVQMVIFCLPLIIIAILGTMSVGGWHVVWEEARKGGRLEFFNMTLNPLERTSFLAAVIGGFFHWTGYNAVNQTCVQRYLSVPTLRAARTTAYIFMVGVIAIITFCTYIGLVMFAYFRTCDPLVAGLVATSDQIVPLFVMRIEDGLHGLPGLFMAGVLSAALSSISVALNSSAGVVLDDLYRPFVKGEVSELKGAIFAKMTCVLLGVLCTGLTMAMSGLQYMIQVAMTLMGIAAGTQFGITSLGMFNPWANWKGALSGGIASLVIMGWISVGNEVMSAAGRLNYPSLPVNVSGCVPAVHPPPVPTMDPTVLPIYRLSFLYVALFGWLVVMIVGSVVSALTSTELGSSDTIDPNTLTPLVASWVRRRQANKKVASLSMERLDRVSVSTVSVTNLKQS